jgi:uncharacterized protein (DUF1330 family)
MEGTLAPKAIVLVEFPNADAVKAWYASPEYRQALKIRDKKSPFVASAAFL